MRLLVVAGCGEPSVPTSAPAKTAASLGKSEWPVLGESGPVLGVDLYALNNYSAAEVEADGERTLAYIKNVLKADVVGIVWNFYTPNPYADPVGATSATLSAGNVGILTRIAAQDHLLVEYRPLVLVPNKPNHWEGLINPYPPAGWFSSYYRAELPYLRIAQQLGVREFVTATELHRPKQQPALAVILRPRFPGLPWRDLICDLGRRLFRNCARHVDSGSHAGVPAGEVRGHGYVLAYEPSGCCHVSGSYGGMGSALW